MTSSLRKPAIIFRACFLVILVVCSIILKLKRILHLEGEGPRVNTVTVG